MLVLHLKKPESSEKFINPSFVSRCGNFFKPVYRLVGICSTQSWWSLEAHQQLACGPHFSIKKLSLWLALKSTEGKADWVHASSPGCRCTTEKQRKHPVAIQSHPQNTITPPRCTDLQVNPEINGIWLHAEIWMLYGAFETHTSLILTTKYSLTGLFFLSFIDNSNNSPGLKPPF